jgi:hypothetical protein
MTRLTASLAVFAAVLLLLTARPTFAQYGPPVGPTPPGSRPPYSPYLNLFRQGSPFYQNYYGLVRPQQQFNQQIVGLQNQVNANRQAISSPEDQQVNAELRPTGHYFGYFTHQGYFLNNGRGVAGGGTGSRAGFGVGSGGAGGFGIGGFGSSYAANRPQSAGAASAPRAPTSGIRR